MSSVIESMPRRSKSSRATRRFASCSVLCGALLIGAAYAFCAPPEPKAALPRAGVISAGLVALEHPLAAGARELLETDEKGQYQDDFFRYLLFGLLFLILGYGGWVISQFKIPDPPSN
eukprot:TRINITY_DN57473_c0_g1_i1.p1 TRINITY_DN57473_c0_g1~~TRINITY_DN57473_c0_g1_i1.p1  ORF type:complete len:118 (-),score=12.37 TRINITY_DN57473_c0_g1_i1:47-400(-)